MIDGIEFVGRKVVFNKEGNIQHGRFLGYVCSIKEDQAYFMVVDNSGATQFLLPCDVKFIILKDEEA